MTITAGGAGIAIAVETPCALRQIVTTRRSKREAGELLIEVLRSIEHGTVARAPMDMAQGSYYSWPDREAVRRFRAAGRRLW
jgi:hypothetical protein